MGNKSGKLTKEDLDFLLAKTNFTKRQIKKWHKGFMVSTFIIHCTFVFFHECLKDHIL